MGGREMLFERSTLPGEVFSVGDPNEEPTGRGHLLQNNPQN